MVAKQLAICPVMHYEQYILCYDFSLILARTVAEVKEFLIRNVHIRDKIMTPYFCYHISIFLLFASNIYKQGMKDKNH
jgi:hypothetical protein